MIESWNDKNVFPPEKYYEACITYHIVQYYEEKKAGRVFPFSISQVQEKRAGFDFGYQPEGRKLFFVQYKRPQMWTAQGGTLVWKVEISQLKTIVEAGIGACTYYALPGFYDYLEWYDALKKTYFLNADDLYTQIRLRKKTDQAAVFVRQDGWRLKAFEDYFSVENVLGNVLIQAADEDDEMPEWNLWKEDFQGYLLQVR